MAQLRTEDTFYEHDTIVLRFWFSLNSPFESNERERERETPLYSVALLKIVVAFTE